MAGVPKRLTEMQIKFAQLLVTNEGRKSPTECAIEAGYDKDSAHVRASELRNPNKFPLVVKYIGEIRDEYQKKYDVTYGRHITELARIRDEARAKGAWSAATNAEVARGKAAGLYIEQKIIHHNKIEDLTSDQLMNKMKTILENNKGLIEADFQEVLAEPTPPERVIDYSSSESSESSESSSIESSESSSISKTS